MFTTSYASMKDFPRFPFFFLLSSPSSLSRQIRHLFRRLGLEGGLSIRSPRRSAIDCYVYRRKPFFNVCQCWRSGVISCIANIQLKRKILFLLVFGVLLSFNLDSVTAFTREILKMYENAAIVHLDDFRLPEYFPIILCHS